MAIVTGNLDIRYMGNKDWMLLSSLHVFVDNEVAYFVIPAGFITDLASMPTRGGNVNIGAVVHDFIYRGNLLTYSRKGADKLFLEIMKESGVGLIRRNYIYRAVRLFGGSSWEGIK